jgi:uncharacterized protein (TIGR02600 family)
VALITVLGVLVLVSALVIAFLASVKTELVSSQSYAYGAGTQQLADSAVSLATALIRDATKGGTAADAPLAWASQPGMIRTYDTSGRPDTFYKLYSSDNMIVSGADFDLADEVPPADWDAQTGLYVDLNAPVRDKDDRWHFPIIDPRAKSTVSGSSIEGFDYWADFNGEAINGVVLPGAGGADSQRLPMPVRWLYVLQDGRLATPATAADDVVTFSGDNLPTADNPIVGRIAFWADDDTCKLNINTASEGTFWDRPWANTETEQHFATAIPAQNEFQRFPGHPAKTALSTVFAPIIPSPNSGTGGPALPYVSNVATNQTQLAAYYDLTPRVSDGATRGGTVNETDSAFRPIVSGTKNDRLYASVDELLYNPARAITASGTLTVSGTVFREFLEQAQFFLTAHNRAPELNLFGQPRLALWPLQADQRDRNTKDKLIAFCTTIGNLPYYFQRYNTYTRAGLADASSQSATRDWQIARNRDLWNYLDNLTQRDIPGFGGSFAAKYDAGVPQTRRQILTEMFDLIRSGVNTYSTVAAGGAETPSDYAPSFRHIGAAQVIPIQPPAADGTQAVGTLGFGRTTTLVGAALVFFRSNMAFFTTTGSTSNGSIVDTDPKLRSALNPQGVIVTPGAEISAVLLLNPYHPSPGLPPLNPHLQYEVSGLQSLKVRGATDAAAQALLFHNDTLTNKLTARGEFSGGANITPWFGVIRSLRYAVDANRDGNKVEGFNGADNQFPFITTSGVPMSKDDTTFDFEGGTIVVKVWDGAKQHLLQTVTMTFPPATGLLMPTSTPYPITTNPANLATNEPFKYFSNARIYEAPGTSMDKPWQRRMMLYFPIPNDISDNSFSVGNRPALGVTDSGQNIVYWVQDISRGIEADPDGPAKGDLRVYAALSNVTADYFRAARAPDGFAAYDTAQLTDITGTAYKYANVQTLRDNTTTSGGGAFGYDNSPYATTPTPYQSVNRDSTYPHFKSSGGGSSTERRVMLLSTISTGLLIPKNKLAAYKGSDGDSSFHGAQEYRSSARPSVANGLNGAYLKAGDTNLLGDWDNLTGLLPDGAYINKPDEGNASTTSRTANAGDVASYDGTRDIIGGYFSREFYGSAAGQGYITDSATADHSTFSPNRQVASAVMFGSLPTGINPADPAHVKPWQTLLFCPNPIANNTTDPPTTNHPGFGTPAAGPPFTLPPDYLFLDLFTMPIVEPYAISEPFSTAGKINMNYQIAPFTYIRRSTGVRAVLKTTRLIAIPQAISTHTGVNSYKDGQRCLVELRYNINPDEETGTLRGFQDRFADNDIFRSAAEICAIHLVPQRIRELSGNMAYPAGISDPTYATTPAWWNNFLLTGDNTREFPYGDLYARLTTKSNTYTVHVRVQSLKKNTATNPAQWDEHRDAIVSEYRGATTVERYIDTNATLPDFATATAGSAENYYKIHIINTKKFQF